MSILDKIVESKLEEIKRKKSETPLEELKEISCRGKLGFISKDNKDVQIIAEIKRASPSKGDIAPLLDPEKKVLEYQNGGASAVSVLTDYPYFKGSLEDFKSASKKAEIPLLRKDFIIDEYQIYESSSVKASAVLLIARILDRKTLLGLYEQAFDLGIVPVIEVFSDEDLIKIRGIRNSFIGVNNRNLSNFDTSLDNVLNIRDRIESSNHVISFSGIRSVEDVSYLSERGVRSFLIGEYLSGCENPSVKIKEMLAS